MNYRPSSDEYFLSIAKLIATRSTCIRRSVGCVLVNERKHILATGYNGRAAGLPHCNDYPPTNACEGQLVAMSGQNLDSCEAIHAEQNAMLQCRDVYQVHTCYVTHSPCITCTKLLMNTSCKRIIFAERYAHDVKSFALWIAGNAGEDAGGTDSKEWLHLIR